MKINKTKLTATITIVLMMISAFIVMINPPGYAQPSEDQPVAGPLPSGVTPSQTVTVIGAFLSATPSLLGEGQPILVNMWIIPPIDRNRALIGGFEVTITKPDGNTLVIGPIDSYAGDATSWFDYPADQTGTWKFKLDFLGMYFPAGYYYNGIVYPDLDSIPPEDVEKSAATQYGRMSAPSHLESAYYEPASSPEVEVEVQQKIVSSWPASPLPTDYWTRPVYPSNREWWPILGNWPPTGIVGGGDYWPANTNKYMSGPTTSRDAYDFVPYAQGPNSAHVVWRRQGAMGGLIGGTEKQITYELFAGTGEIGFPNIIYNGKCYQSITKVGQTGA
jgi:hypothetical protein